MHFYAIKSCILCILNAFHTQKSTTIWFLNHGPWRRFEPCHVLVSWPCSWRYFTLIFSFYIFMKTSDSLYSIIYVYYVVWVIQAVLEIFFRIRVLNEHQTGGCMTMRYPPPAPGRHHHTLYNNRYWYVESKGSSLHYHHVRFTEPGHSNRSNYKKTENMQPRSLNCIKMHQKFRQYSSKNAKAKQFTTRKIQNSEPNSIIMHIAYE